MVYGYFDRELKEYLMGGRVSPMDLFDLWKRVDFKHLGFMEKLPRDSEAGFQVEDVYVDEELSSEDMDYDMEEFVFLDDTSYQEYWVKRHMECSEQWDLDYMLSYGHHPSLDVQ